MKDDRLSDKTYDELLMLEHKGAAINMGHIIGGIVLMALVVVAIISSLTHEQYKPLPTVKPVCQQVLMV